MEKLQLSFSYYEDEKFVVLFNQYLLEALPQVVRRGALRVLRIPGWLYNDEQLMELANCKEHFSKIENFYLCEASDWPRFKKIVGEFASAPESIREGELRSNISVWPKSAQEMRIQIAGLYDQVDPKDDASLSYASLYAGVMTRELDKKLVETQVVVIDGKTFSVLESAKATHRYEDDLPPELQYYNEIPALLMAFEKLKSDIHLVICQGRAEKTPYGFGLANYVGLKLGLPTIGCVDEISYGSYDDPEDEACECTPVKAEDGHLIGCCLKTQSGQPPVFVLQLSHKYRLPEPLRVAQHKLFNETKGNGR